MTMEPPEPPNESDCCNSGCNPCILDVYEAQLKKYKEGLKNSSQNSDAVNCMSPTSYTSFKLVKRVELSLTVFLLTFEYDDLKEKTPNCFKYRPGQYLLLRGKDCDGEFTRAYTPLPTKNDNLSFVVLVRIYLTGRMSKLLKKLQIGHKTAWRGPYGDFEVNYKYKYLLFVAQGTGVAPIFAVVQEMINKEECETFIKLFFCCRDPSDILLREELYQLSHYWNFSYEIFLSKSDNLVTKYNETVHTNKLTPSDLSNYINGKNNLQVVICGSDNFIQSIKIETQKLGIQSSHIYSF